MLLSPSWKPSSPESSPFALEPLHSPPPTTTYSDSAAAHHDVLVADHSYTHVCDAESKDEKPTTPLPLLYGSLGSHQNGCREPPHIACSSAAFLSAPTAIPSSSLSPFPQLSPAVTPPPSNTLREAATPSTKTSSSSFIATLTGLPPRVYDSTFNNSNVAAPQSQRTPLQPAFTSPFTLPRVEGERSGSPPRELYHTQRPPPPLPHDISLSHSPSSSMFSSHSLPNGSSAGRRQPMFGAYGGSHSLHRHSLLAPWAPSRHVPLHILADSFSSLASYTPLYSNFDEQYGNSYQPYPHSLHYHHADVLSNGQHSKQPVDNERPRPTSQTKACSARAGGAGSLLREWCRRSRRARQARGERRPVLRLSTAVTLASDAAQCSVLRAARRAEQQCGTVHCLSQTRPRSSIRDFCHTISTVCERTVRLARTH